MSPNGWTPFGGPTLTMSAVYHHDTVPCLENRPISSTQNTHRLITGNTLEPREKYSPPLICDTPISVKNTYM